MSGPTSAIRPVPDRPRGLWSSKTSITFAACLCLLAALTLALARNIDRAEAQGHEAQWWRFHTLDVLLTAEQVDTALNKALRGERGYVLTLHPRPLATYRVGLADYRRLGARLRDLTRDNPRQQRRLAELDRRVDRFADTSRDVVDRAMTRDMAGAIAAVRTGREREALENASVILDAVKSEERALLRLRETRNAESAARTRAYGQALVGMIGLLVFALIGAVAAALRARERAVRAAAAVADSERRYRLLADNASDVVLRTGDDGAVIYASPSCVELSGFTPAELIGRPCADFIHPDDFAAVHAAHVAIITGARAGMTVEYRLRNKHGGWRWLESHMKPWRVPDDPDGGVISAIRDIGGRKALEEELRAARDAAEAAANVKANFLSNMSHEIRTPMNGVLGFTDLVLSGDLAPDQRRHLELIAESGRSMMRLLNDILDISKIEAGRMVLAQEPVDLRHIARRCTDLMTPVARAKGVTLSAIVDATVPARIVGDPLRLRQVLLNLLGNAVKFTEQGSITVAATARDDCLRVDVTDTGIGIPADRLSAIFDQFSQADLATAGRYGGTGLGLSISGELVRLMGGTIAVRSTVGQGSTFTVSIPLVAAADAPVPQAAALRPSDQPAPAVRRPRVLIAEDHDINQALITAMAERAGMDAVVAPDGVEAIAMCEAAARSGRPFQLILMDMQMPRMGGLEATRRLRAAGHEAARLPIVALTANAFAEDVAACLDAGMQAHLAKPVGLGDLTAVLARFVPTVAPEPARPAAIGPGLLDRYRARRAATLATLERLAVPGDVDAAALNEALDLLHKLAGTAAMFGDAALGDGARAIEEGLPHWSAQDRARHIGAMLSRHRDAA